MNDLVEAQKMISPIQASYARFFMAAMLSGIVAACSSCSRCTASVHIINRTGHTFEAKMSMPYPAYMLFKDHCRFHFALHKKSDWNTRDANPVDIAMTRIHGGVILQLSPIEYENELRPAEYYAEVNDCGTIVIGGEWPGLEVSAEDCDGRPVAVDKIHAGWFK